MSYWKRHGSKIIKRCKKYNYRIIESYNYNDIEGYVYSFYLEDYNGENIIEVSSSYSLIEQCIKEIEKRGCKNGN